MRLPPLIVTEKGVDDTVRANERTRCAALNLIRLRLELWTMVSIRFRRWGEFRERVQQRRRRDSVVGASRGRRPFRVGKTVFGSNCDATIWAEMAWERLENSCWLVGRSCHGYCAKCVLRVLLEGFQFECAL